MASAPVCHAQEDECNEGSVLISGEEKALSRLGGRSMIASIGAGLLLAACLLAFFCVNMSQHSAMFQSDVPSVSLRKLFESPVIIDAATDATMLSGIRHGKLTKSDRAGIKDCVAIGFKEVGDRLAATPETAKKFEAHIISGRHHRALAAHLRMSADERVQAVGALVHKIVLEADEDDDVQHLKQRILMELQPHQAELRNLLKEFIPQDLLDVGNTEESLWTHILSERKLKALRARKAPRAAEDTLAKGRRMQWGSPPAPAPISSSGSWGSSPGAPTWAWAGAPAPAPKPPPILGSSGTYGSWGAAPPPASGGMLGGISMPTTNNLDVVYYTNQAIEKGKALIDAVEMAEDVTDNGLGLSDGELNYLEAANGVIDVMECMSSRMMNIFGTGMTLKSFDQVQASLTTLTGATNAMQIVECPQELGENGQAAIKAVLAKFGINNVTMFDVDPASRRRRRSVSSQRR